MKSRAGPFQAKLDGKHSMVEVRELRLLQSELSLSVQHGSPFSGAKERVCPKRCLLSCEQCPTLLYMQERLLSDSLLKTMLEPRRRIHTLPIRNLHKHALSGTLKVGGCSY